MTNQTLSTALRPRSFAIRLGVTTLATGVVIAVLAGPRGSGVRRSMRSRPRTTICACIPQRART